MLLICFTLPSAAIVTHGFNYISNLQLCRVGGRHEKWRPISADAEPVDRHAHASARSVGREPHPLPARHRLGRGQGMSGPLCQLDHPVQLHPRGLHVFLPQDLPQQSTHTGRGGAETASPAWAEGGAHAQSRRGVCHYCHCPGPCIHHRLHWWVWVTFSNYSIALIRPLHNVRIRGWSHAI